MHVLIENDYEALAESAAAIIAMAVAAKPDAAILLATGNTPIGVYRCLAGMRSQGTFDASRLRVFQLDAYLGVTPEDPRSLYGWLDREFLRPLGVPDSHVVRFSGDPARCETSITAYRAALDVAGGIDVAVLGLGPNGHVGFNEPPSDCDAHTRRISLTDASIQSNARYWGGRGRVPAEALTCGLDAIVNARHILLLVSGDHKREILGRTLRGPITPDVPASYLRNANRLTVIADREAWGADNS